MEKLSPLTAISRYQDVSILDFFGYKDDGIGSDNWSYKTCKAPVKSSPPTNQHPTNSVKSLLKHLTLSRKILTNSFLVVMYDVFTHVVVRKDDAVVVTGAAATSDTEQHAKH